MGRYLLSLLLLLGVACSNYKGDFIKIESGRFIKSGEPYYYIGTNFWYGAILGSQGEGGDRVRLHQELDLLKSLGVTNLRVLVGADGKEGVVSKVEPTLQRSPREYNDQIFDGLDYLMAELAKRDMQAVLYLNNSWEWSGGYSHYLMWSGEGDAPIPSIDGWPAYMDYVKNFVTNDKAKELFAHYVRDAITRTNRYTGVKYVDDPTIFSWQIGNEPRAFSEENLPSFEQWIGEVARLIRSLDKNHMISTGSEGKHGCEQSIESWQRIHSYPEIAYVNFHIWPFNWQWIDVDDMEGSFELAITNTQNYINEHLPFAVEAGKPIVIEEFGCPRDEKKFALGKPTEFRDLY